MSRFENHRVQFLLLPVSHVTRTPKVKKPITFGVNGNKILCWSIFAKTYGCFLFVFGLLIFKECITWPRYKGWTCFSYHVPVLCWSISSVESIADFCPFWDYWPSKNGSREDDIKGEFVSLAKPFVFGTTGKKILC